MANVTQRTPDIIGGISRLPDFDKDIGEVREALNCYPDLSYGMTKRPGTKLIGALDGIVTNQVDDTHFFPIFREGKPRYLAGISPTAVKVWDLENPDNSINVINEAYPDFNSENENRGDATDYLTLPTNNTTLNPYRISSDDRRTVIVNRTRQVEENQTLWSRGILQYDDNGDLIVDANGDPEFANFEFTIRKRFKEVANIDGLPSGELDRVNFTTRGDASKFDDSFPQLRAGTHYLPLNVRKTDDSTGTEVAIKTAGKGAVIKVHIDENGLISVLGGWQGNVNVGNPNYYLYTQRGAEVAGKSAQWFQDNTVYTYDELRANGVQIIDVEAEIWSAGSGYPDGIKMTVEGVPGTRLAGRTGLLVGAVHEVVNADGDKDNFYMQAFSAEEDLEPGEEAPLNKRIEGPYFWKECPSPEAYIGLDERTLPHELIEGVDADGNVEFTFRAIDYSYRWVGNNKNNPAPSFVGHKINNVFFLNNRLGFLSEDCVILSRPINYGPQYTNRDDFVPDGNPWISRNYQEVDFFRQSAIGVTDADPIDLKAANNEVSIFHKVISTPQGVILFADGQQSLLWQPQGLLSPLTASLNSISNYDMSDNVLPIVLGDTCYFVNQSKNFCKVYSLINRGMQNPPIIEDITYHVPDWLPPELTHLVPSFTNDMLLGYVKGSTDVYCRRKLTNERSAWTRWSLGGKIVGVVIDHDEVYFLSKEGDGVVVSRADAFVLGNDSSFRFAPSGIAAIPEDVPSDYDYTKKLIGRKQLKPGKFATIQFYIPEKPYYANMPAGQNGENWAALSGRWLSLDQIGYSSALATAFYSVDVTASNPPSIWAEYTITFKDNSNEVLTVPTGATRTLPYDTLFRLNDENLRNSDFIEGCVESSDCARLMYMTPSGTEVSTDAWGIKIKSIDTSSDPVVVTLDSCNETPDITVNIAKANFHDAYLMNMMANNCRINPDDYRYVRRVIVDSTLNVTTTRGDYENPSVYVTSPHIGSIVRINDRTLFPIKDWWWEKNVVDDYATYIGFLGPRPGTWSSLGCAGPDWGFADEFFCRENPGRMLNSNVKIEYMSTENYIYNWSSNNNHIAGFGGRPDINYSQTCQFKDDGGEFIGDYDEGQDDDGTDRPTGLVGKKWGTYNYVHPENKNPRDWFARTYGNCSRWLSACGNDDKFTGWFLGGRITRYGRDANVSSGRTAGWAYDGYSARTPWDFPEGDYFTYDDAGDILDLDHSKFDADGITQYVVSFSTPMFKWCSDRETRSEYSQYVRDFGQHPPGEIYLRMYYELTNSPDPYAADAVIDIYTDSETTDACDSCPPLEAVIDDACSNDLKIRPYLDFHTKEITLEDVNTIIPPASFPYIQGLTPCLLLASFPGESLAAAPRKTGYEETLKWNDDNTKLITTVDLTNEYVGRIIIGYRYKFLVELPRFYFKGPESDFSAKLTIARIKAAIGFAGDYELSIRKSMDENVITNYWSQTFSAATSNFYLANGSPITESSVAAIPVHKRTEDFYFRIGSSGPFPLCIDSVAWEGNYSPKYYRRL